MYRLLFVDDEPDILASTKSFFTKRGYEVSVASDGQVALDLTTKIQFDLIVTDVNMPGLNGFEFCKKLKANSKTANIPVIVLSGHPKTEDSLTFAGAHVFLPKPCNFDNLELVIKKTFAKSKGSRKIKVLIFADDHINANEILRFCKKDSLFEAQVVQNPKDIINVALTFIPDLFLIDIFVSELQPNEIIKALRAFNILNRMRILTFYVSPKDWLDNPRYKVKVSDLSLLNSKCKDAGSGDSLGAFTADTFLQSLKSYALQLTD